MSLSTSSTSTTFFTMPPTISSIVTPRSFMNIKSPFLRSSMILYPYCITAVVICIDLAPKRIKARASFQVSMPPIAEICFPSSALFCESSEMNLIAIGRTEFPEKPPTATLPLPGSISIRLFMVFMAAIPSAPPLTDASAAGLIMPTFGVSLERMGRFVPLRAAFVKSSTTLGDCPTSEPVPSSTIFGHEKLSSIASAPASVTFLERYSHSSSSRPIIEARRNLFG